MTAATGYSRGARVLLLEDDDMVAVMLQTALERAGLACQRAKTLDEAGRMSARTGCAFDLLVCDRHLPDGIGTDFAASLRAQGWEGKMFLLSADPQAGACAAGDVDAALQKGCALSEIVAVAKELSSSGGGAPRASGPGIPKALLDGFKRSLSGDLAVLSKLDCQHDRAHILSLAHRLQGSAGLYGEETLREAAKACAQAGRVTDEAAFEENFRLLLGALERAALEGVGR